MFETDLNAIVTANVTVAEKLSKLEECRVQMLQQVETAKQQVTADYKYCEQCKNWYKRKTFETVQRYVTRKVTMLTDAAVEGKFRELHQGTFKITYTVCPAGHEAEVSKTLIC